MHFPPFSRGNLDYNNHHNSRLCLCFSLLSAWQNRTTTTARHRDPPPVPDPFAVASPISIAGSSIGIAIPFFSLAHSLLCGLHQTWTPPWKMNRVIHSSTAKFRHFHRHRGPPSSSASSFYLLWRHRILEPDGEIVTHWNQVFLITCLLALFIDPLYFYLPSVGGPVCLKTDTSLKVTVTVFRTVADLFYLLHMIMKFRTGFVAPSSRVFGRGDLVMDPREIAIRYLKADFMVDLAATLPLPQASQLFSCILAGKFLNVVELRVVAIFLQIFPEHIVVVSRPRISLYKWWRPLNFVSNLSCSIRFS